MLFAAALCVVAVALGLGLGLVPAGRARVAGPLRTFALSAALTVVLLHLLPEAFSELGALALLLFAATSIFPAWLGLARGVFGSHHDADGAVHGGLAAGYVGLLVHHVGDGLGLGAYASLPGGAEQHADVMLALAAHTVPLVAVVAYAFQRAGGVRRALFGAAGLAGASVLGVFLSSTAPEALVARYSAWVAALVAGLLVHVVTHDLGRDLPTSAGGRALDAVAAIAGVMTSLLGGEDSAGNHPGAFFTAVARILMSLALPVLVGWLLATLLTRGKKGTFRRALEAAFGVNLAVDGLVLTTWMWGLVSGFLFAAGALLVVGAVSVCSPKHAEPEAQAPRTSESDLPLLIRIDDLVAESVPWVFAAFAFLALVESSFPVRVLEMVSLPVALALAVVVALPARVPTVAAVLIAAALERAGLRFEAALVFMLIAPAPGTVELTELAHHRGKGAALRLAFGIVGSALAVGCLAAVGQSFIAPRTAPLFPTLTSRLALLLVAALGVRAAFDRSVRGLLLQIFHSHDTASHAETSEPSPHTPPLAAAADRTQGPA